MNTGRTLWKRIQRSDIDSPPARNIDLTYRPQADRVRNHQLRLSDQFADRLRTRTNDRWGKTGTWGNRHEFVVPAPGRTVKPIARKRSI